MVPKILEQLLKYRALYLICTLLLGMGATLIFFNHWMDADNSLPQWFEKSDPDFQHYQQFMRHFGDDRFVVLTFKVPHAYDTQVLEFISYLTNRLETLPEVIKAHSLTKALFLNHEKDTLTAIPLISSIPPPAHEKDLIKNRLLLSPWGPYLVSNQETMVSIVAQVEMGQHYKDSALLKKKLVGLVEAVNTAPYPFFLSGTPILDEAFNRLVIRDQHFFFPASVILTIGLMALFFRNWMLVGVVTLVQYLLLVIILALYYTLGYKLNVVTAMVCPILIAASTANMIHWLEEYHTQREKNVPRTQALTITSHLLTKPILYTALTTIIGFISFGPSNIPPVSLVGLLTACGIGLAFLLVLFLLPVLVSFLPDKVILKQSSFMRQDWLSYIIHKTTHFVFHHLRLIVMATCFLTFIAGLGLTRLNFETNFHEYFFENEKARQDLAVIETHVGPINSFEIWFQGSKSLAHDPKLFATFNELKKEFLKNPLIIALWSPADVIQLIHQALNQDLSKPLPTTKAEIAELELMASSLDDETTRALINPQGHWRLSLRIPSLSSETMVTLLKDIHPLVTQSIQNLPLQTTLTGYGSLLVRLQNNLLFSQIVSLGSSFVFVTLMMFLFLKNIRLGLLSMIPNALPVILIFGLMGFAHIPLNVATIMIAGVSIGITVDDTIHYFTRFQQFKKEGASTLQALEQVHASIGRAIVFSSLVLGLGFGLLCAGSFTPTVYFGALVGLTLIVAMICELCLTPLLIKKFFS